MVEATVGTTELVRITHNVIGDEEVNSVDARELHAFLEVQSKFADWIKNRISKYEFIQDTDFITILNSENSPPSKEYYITMGMAKELAMVERNEKGREARKYFIECERKLAQVTHGAQAPQLQDSKMPTLVSDFRASLELGKLLNLGGDQAILSANKAVIKLHGVDCMALLDVASPIAPKFLTPTELGKKLGMSAVDTNLLLKEARLQIYSRGFEAIKLWTPTKLGALHSQTKGDGYYKQQTWWSESMIPLCEKLLVAEEA